MFNKNVFSQFSMADEWIRKGTEGGLMSSEIKLTGVWRIKSQSSGRGLGSRSSQNPGIAKKGGGVTHAKIFFGGFLEVSPKPYSGITQPK